jgi:hypothetical protein
VLPREAGVLNPPTPLAPKEEHMKDFLVSLLREFAQKGVGIAVVWLVAHGIDVPEAVTNWVVLTIVTVGLLIWTAVVRFLETRDSAFARAIARLLMLGIKAKPAYPVKESESVTYLREQQGQRP